MRIHPPHVTEAEVLKRRRLGLDHRDEEWEGVYHVVPSPSLESIIAPDGIRGGAPDAVIEILSPHDDSYRKFAFYAALGVPEVITVEPEGRTAEVWRLADGSYERAAESGDGTVVSRSLEVSFRSLPGAPPRLELADRRDASRSKSI